MPHPTLPARGGRGGAATAPRPCALAPPRTPARPAASMPLSIGASATSGSGRTCASGAPCIGSRQSRVCPHARSLAPAAPRTAIRAAASAPDAPASAHADLDAAARDALMLCWFAAQRRSLFATRCLADVVLELYRRGTDPASPLTALALARLASGGEALGGQAAAVLSSWVTLAFMTLEEVGAARHPGVDAAAVPRAGDGSATDAGMRAFARQTVTKFAGGAGARRLLTAQVLAAAGREGRLPGGDGGGGGGGGDDQDAPTAVAGGLGGLAAVMQANARVCVLTLDAARGAGVAVGVPLDRLEARLTGGGSGDGDDDDEDGGGEGGGGGGDDAPFGPPVGFAAGALPPRAGAAESPGAEAAAASARATAARLLLSFLGAAGVAAAAPAAAFVEAAAGAYRSGATASGALAPLRPDELAAAGPDAAVPVVGAGADDAGPGAALLRQWVSVVFMALALKGVPHPRAAGRGGDPSSVEAGWAFAGDAATGAAEAYGLARVVAGALEGAGAGAGGAGATGEKPGAAPAVVLASAAAARAKGSPRLRDYAAGAGGGPDRGRAAQAPPPPPPPAPGGIVVMEDASLSSTSAALFIVRQQVGLAVAAGALVDAKAGEWGLVPAGAA